MTVDQNKINQVVDTLRKQLEHSVIKTPAAAESAEDFEDRIRLAADKAKAL